MYKSIIKGIEVHEQSKNILINNLLLILLLFKLNWIGTYDN